MREQLIQSPEDTDSLADEDTDSLVPRTSNPLTLAPLTRDVGEQALSLPHIQERHALRAEAAAPRPARPPICTLRQLRHACQLLRGPKCKKKTTPWEVRPA